MAKQKVRATRHNGRKGENGVFKAGHNDRSFDVDTAEHIDSSRSFMNVYWDMYQGYNISDANGVRPERRFSFEEIEKAFYCNQFGDSLDAQTERHIKSRHKDRIRTMDQIREDPKTCPEETVYQLGTKDGHEDPALFVQVVAELVEEFTKRFGSHVQVLDWALHMDEATPHIHERHVFFADDGYGMYFPKQEKACEALGFERPNLEKKSNKFNNAKMVFDEEVRKLYIEIAEKYGVVIEKIPLEGKKHLEKNDYILAKQAEEIANNEARLQSLELKIEDVETFSEEILEAGNFAPNAGGGQRSMMVAIHNADITKKVGIMNMANFNRKGLAGSYVSKEQPSVIDDPTMIDGFYGAPTVVAIFAQSNFMFRVADAFCMAENMILQATELGIASCIISRGEETFASEEGKKLVKEWGVPDNYICQAFVILGYIDGEQPHSKPRKPGRIQIIE